MKKKLIGLSVLLATSLQAQAGIVGLDLIEAGDDAVADISGALFAPGSGITITGTPTFVGAVGDGVTANTAQSGIFAGVNITDGTTTVSMGGGVVLTTGTANIPSTNTNSQFNPFIPATGSDSDLAAILTAASAPSSVTNDVNFFEFDFTLDAGLNAISLDFIFGSDEFPDQAVTDVFGVFVDGTNYAFFPDSSLVSFVLGDNASNFQSNTGGAFDIEYDGFSNKLSLIGLIDENLSTHTLKIAIADTFDSVFDSGVFLSNLTGTTTEGGGGVVTDVSEPYPLLLLAGGLGMMLFRRKIR
ncbi:choice-of-anchor L family PEP-CTERM protein [Alteromonas lipolytica]|uniref:PEP-CTERM protein-sorting domain-containing protein n=2 Tax=Alteromonas lipolytica TaxID=1856405 RepID=A0A1E8F9Z2_9ALTE|nr:choice-of-anchor L domain-containing protein [Alteromonas lipolytica]OFI32744.1 hypothetical protein BFC17_06225 [Alteromonas lipolytica]